MSDVAVGIVIKGDGSGASKAALQVANDLGKIGTTAGAVGNAGARGIETFGRGLSRVGLAAGQFALGMKSGEGAISTFLSTGTALLTMFGGPWGIAIGAAIGIVGALATSMGLLGNQAVLTAAELKALQLTQEQAGSATDLANIATARMRDLLETAAEKTARLRSEQLQLAMATGELSIRTQKQTIADLEGARAAQLRITTALRARSQYAREHGLDPASVTAIDAQIQQARDDMAELEALLERLKNPANLGFNREGETELIDAQTDSITQLLSRMREEVELLHLSADAREEELAVRQAAMLSMEKGDALGEEEEAQIRALVRAKQALARADDDVTDMADRVTDALRDQQDAAGALGDAMNGIGRVGSSLFRNLTSGADSFGDALQNLGDDLLDLANDLAFSFLQGALKGFDWSSLFGGGAAGPPPVGGSGPVNVAHGGGVVGRSRFPQRRMPASAFAGAPHFMKGGIVGGEVPVIAHEGEVIGWPGQLRQAFGGGDVLVQVIDQRGKGAPIQTEQRQGPDGLKILRIMIRDEGAAAIRNGEWDSAMGASFGVRRSGASR